MPGLSSSFALRPGPDRARRRTLCLLRVEGSQSPRRAVVHGGPVGCLLIAMVLAGCGGKTATGAPSEWEQRDAAAHFAAAILRGDAAGARALLAQPDAPALGFLLRRAAGTWRGQHASIRPPARRSGDRWTFRYAGTRTHGDGRFERESGELVVVVAPAAARAEVAFFAFRNVSTRFSTHHDAQLLPSKR
jgi:hypothetical protein